MLLSSLRIKKKNSKIFDFHGFSAFFTTVLSLENRQNSCKNFFLANFVKNNVFFHKIKTKFEKNYFVKI